MTPVGKKSPKKKSASGYEMLKIVQNDLHRNLLGNNWNCTGLQSDLTKHQFSPTYVLHCLNTSKMFVGKKWYLAITGHELVVEKR